MLNMISGFLGFKRKRNDDSDEGENNKRSRSQESTARASIEILPNEVLAMLANRLPPKDVAAFRATSKQCKEIVDVHWQSGTAFIKRLESLSQTPLNITEKEKNSGLSFKRAEAVFDEVALAQWKEIQYINKYWRKKDAAGCSHMTAPAATLAELEDKNEHLDRMHCARIKACIDENREILFLGGKHLTRFPVSILTDESLSRYWGAFQLLSLEHNQLTAIPPELGNLQALRSLSFDNNRLTAIPPELGNLQALRYLSLNNNQLTAIPPELGNLPALQGLFLYNNQLTVIPPEVIARHGEAWAAEVLGEQRQVEAPEPRRMRI